MTKCNTSVSTLLLHRIPIRAILNKLFDLSVRAHITNKDRSRLIQDWWNSSADFHPESWIFRY